MRSPHHQHSAPATGFVDPYVLARISNLELAARFAVDGFINGLHRSPYLGLSLDFAEHRAYMPGDDIRRIDWKLWARTDRYYVKEFEADTNANFVVLLDISKSMNYASKGISKLDYGKFLGASLAYFSNQQRDRVGLVTFDQDIAAFVPPSAKHLNVVLHEIDRAKPARSGSLGPALQRAAGTLNRRGILVLISDLYEEPDQVFEAVKPLRFKGNDLIVFHVLDPAEIEFPFEGASSFEDVETGERIPVVPETQRERYRELIQNHIGALSKRFTDNQIEYQLFDTATPLDYALFTYLSNRERLMKTR
ncbi:MAG: DUF58 domain-containing protein [Longimicrobiales bacterium]